MTVYDWFLENNKFLDDKELLYLIKGVLGGNLDFSLNLQWVAEISLNLCLKRRLAGEPLAKILGLKYFYKDCFLTNEYTLDPRPESEFLLEKIVGKPRSVLELGVGSGCLILSILKNFDKCKGIGVDIDPLALSVAQENACILNLENKVQFSVNDWASGISGHYDLVIANPPYVDLNEKLSNETLFDPHLALFGDIKTYFSLLDSLNQISFNQLLLEVPKNLLQELLQKLQNFSKNIEFWEIWNSEIYCVSVI